MRDDRRSYLLVGVFVLGMLAALLVWLAVLSGGIRPTDRYYTVYDRVMGLTAGTQVLYEGFPVGLIEGIEPIEREGRRRFRVDLSVPRDWPVPVDSRAVITAPGVLSAVVIDLRGGRATELLAPGSEIRADVSPNPVASVGLAADEVRHMLHDQVEPVLKTLSEGTPEILDNLRSFTASLDDSGQRLRAVLGPDNVGRIEAILANAERTSAELARMSRDLGATRGRLDALLGRAQKLLDEDEGELGHALVDLHHTLEASARHSDAIAQDLERTSRNLAEFSRRVRENPALLLRGGADGGPD